MKLEQQMETLLRWREVEAMTDAPVAPRASQLLTLAEPWWQIWPEQFKRLADRLCHISVAYALQVPESTRRSGHAIPALIARGDQELETTVQALYLSVRDQRIRFRFQFDSSVRPTDALFELTFVVAATTEPVCSATAIGSMPGEYSLDAELPASVAQAWRSLKVTDAIPFRLILRPAG